jgi:hypothetical protein
MAQSEIESVLANWIEQALSPIGKLPAGVTPSEWVAKNFINWWRTQVEYSLGDAELASQRLRDELQRLGGWNKLGEAMEEITHTQEALADLRRILSTDSGTTPDAAGM